jgi:hypothetical protein
VHTVPASDDESDSGYDVVMIVVVVKVSVVMMIHSYGTFVEM